MGPGDDMGLSEVLRRHVGESDEEYLTRMLDARMRVIGARFGSLEAKMSTVLDGFGDIRDRQEKQEERHERVTREFFESEARILKAITDYQASTHANCRAVGQVAADVVRAYGASWPLVALSALALVIGGAWLLDLVPNVETDVGRVGFEVRAPTSPATQPLPQ